MKKLVWYALVLSFSIMIAAPASRAQAKPAPAAPPLLHPLQRKRLRRWPRKDARSVCAIFDFDYATVQTSSAALFGTNVDVGKGISDLLVTDLVKDGTYSVIERKALDKI